MRTLLLVPPSFSRFDSAGARFPARRKTASMWYPVWLCYCGGLIDDSRVIDCPADDIDVERILRLSKGYDLVVMHTSTASLGNDVRTAECLKGEHDCEVALVGPHPSVLPTETLRLSDAIDYVARREYDRTIKELAEGKPVEEIRGLSWRKDGEIHHNPDRPFIEDLDSLSFVSAVYKRDLDVTRYHLPFLLHPYVSIMTGRSCPYNCSFCLWPQAFLGRRYRTRSPQNVIDEITYIRENLPEVREVFFDDGTFTALPRRVLEICRLMREHGLDVTWSCNARPDVSIDVLKEMKKAGCRLLVVGYESGSQEVLDAMNKGTSIDGMRRFTRECREVGLMIHGTFMIGTIGETRETIEKTIRFACELNLDSVQFSVATPFPGTRFYDECREKGYLRGGSLLDSSGYQECIVEYPWLSADEIVEAVDRAYVQYYYRLGYVAKQLTLMMTRPRETRRILLGALRLQRYFVENAYHRFVGTFKAY